MSQIDEKRRSISEFSDIELELQKACYRQASFQAIASIAHALSELNKYGICVRRITNYGINNYYLTFSRSIRIITGMPLTLEGKFPLNDAINVTWDFCSDEIIQHVIEPEEP